MGNDRRGIVGWTWVGALLFGLLASLSCADRSPTRRPNVILIMADTLRADRLGAYGHPASISPEIDRFAKDSLLFTKCLSHASDTRHSCASLLSGFLPHETGILENKVLPEGVQTLAEILRDEGYATAAVIGNYVLRAGQGFEQGFDLYDDTMEEQELVRKWPERIAEKTTDRAIELLEQRGDQPLFLWVVYQDAHGPYAPPAEFLDETAGLGTPSRKIRRNQTLTGYGGIPAYQQLGQQRDYRDYVRRYEGEIRYLDHHFGRLLDKIDELGIADDSAIVFTSDHGEGMGEHDYYFAHGEHLYNELTHVPLIIRWGDRLQGRRDDVVQQADLLPTLLDLLEIERDLPFRGTSLLDRTGEQHPVVAEMRSSIARDRSKISLVHNGFKLILTPPERLELYDLETDPGEQNDLSASPQHRQRLQDLHATLMQARGEDRLMLGNQEAVPGLTPEEQEKLRSLGYVQ